MSSRTRQRYRAGLALAAVVGFAAFLVVIVYLADTRNLGFLYEVYGFRHGDKVGHFLLYGTLSLLAILALFQLLPGRNRVRLALLAAVSIALLVSLEELSQLWLPARSPDWWDLVVGYSGIAAFGCLALLIGDRLARR